jgi:acetyl esterase/lipase
LRAASLALSAATLGIGLFIWLPAPTYALGRLAVGAAVAAMVPPLSVFARLPATMARFDREMARGLGEEYVADITPQARAALRPRRVSAHDLLLGLPATPGVAVTRGLNFASTGGATLRVDVYRPTATGSWPVVLQLYGGAWRSGGPEDDARLAAALADSGYVVVAADYRHAPEWRWPVQRDDVRARRRMRRSSVATPRDSRCWAVRQARNSRSRSRPCPTRHGCGPS